MRLTKKFLLSTLFVLVLPASAFAIDITCPSGTDVAAKLQNINMTYDDGDIIYNVRRVGEKIVTNMLVGTTPFYGAFVTVALKQRQNLTVTLDSIANAVAYFDAEGNKSYVACRYRVIESNPGFSASDTYTILADQGLAPIVDGNFNLEAVLPNMNCTAANQRVTCVKTN